MKKISWFLLVVIVLLSIYIGFSFKKPIDRIYSNEGILLDVVNNIQIVHDFLPEDSIRRTNEIRYIKWIVVHETDNVEKNAGALNHSNYLKDKDNEKIVSWHYTVDDKNIVHHVEDHFVSWHAGDKRTLNGGNMNGIGIEICVNKDSDYELALHNTACLIAKLLISYNLTIDDVKFHRDFSGKICPHRLLTEGNELMFIEMIRDEYKLLNIKKSS